MEMKDEARKEEKTVNKLYRENKVESIGKKVEKLGNKEHCQESQLLT